MGVKDIEAELLAYANGFPGAEISEPWGHYAVKAGGKTFVLLSGEAGDDGWLGMTVKLPTSGEMALSLDYVERARYNLGKSGWVTLRQAESDEIDIGMLKGWIEQSYRAIATKKLVKELDDRG